MRQMHIHLNRARRRQRRRNAGMTLVEIMVVVIIMALIATGVAALVLPALDRANVRQTETDCQAIRGAATQYLMYETGADCPSMQDLTEGDYLDDQVRTQDAWNNDFNIECEGREVYVSSAGPDEEWNTEDDIPQSSGD